MHGAAIGVRSGEAAALHAGRAHRRIVGILTGWRRRYDGQGEKSTAASRVQTRVLLPGLHGAWDGTAGFHDGEEDGELLVPPSQRCGE